MQSFNNNSTIVLAVFIVSAVIGVLSYAAYNAVTSMTNTFNSVKDENIVNNCDEEMCLYGQ